MSGGKNKAAQRTLSVSAALTMMVSLGMPMSVYAEDSAGSIQEPASGGMTATMTASGTVTAVAGASSYSVTAAGVTDTAVNTSYGTMAIDADGNYTYTLDPTKLPQKVKCSLDANGTPYVDPDGTIIHLPQQDTPLSDTVSVSADGQDDGTITISIQGINYAPYTIGTPEQLSLSEDGVTTASGTLNNVFSDDEGFGNLTFTVNGKSSSTGTYGTLQLNSDGGYEFDLDNAAAQSLSSSAPVSQTYTITATDSHGASTTADLNILISGSDDTPEISSQYTAMNSDGLSGMLVYRDIDNSARGTSIVGVDSDSGSVSFDDNGTATVSGLGTIQLSKVSATDDTMNDWQWYSFAITPDASVQANIPAGQTVSVGFQFTVNDGTNSIKGPSFAAVIASTAQPSAAPSSTTPASTTAAATTPTVPSSTAPASTAPSTPAAPASSAPAPSTTPKQDRNAPEVSINYQAETVNCDPSMEYSIGAGMVWQDCSANMNLSDFKWDGSFTATVYFRYKEDDTHNTSDAQSLVIPSRPAAPSLSVNNTTESVEIPEGYSCGTDPDDLSMPGGEQVTLAPEQTLYAVINATDTAFRSNIEVITAPKRAATPTVTINYDAETLNVSLPTQYSLDGGLSYHDCISGMPVSSLGWNGSTAVNVLFRNPSGDTQYVSEVQTVSIAARPARPSVKTTNESYAGKKDGTIQNVSTAMEVRNSGSGTWTSCTGNTVSGLAAGNYQVRIKATGGSFRSAASDCAIADQSGATRILSVDNITFANAEYGYAPYAKQTFKIKNSGNADATITDFKIVGSNDFDLDGLKNAGVPAGYELDNWAIAPKSGLEPGTHTGTLVLTYDNGATCTATITFVVTRAEQSAPSTPVLDSVTENSIAVKEISANKTTNAAAVYSIDGGRTWQDSTVFKNLSAGTQYSIISRYVKMNDYKASNSSSALTAVTVKSTVTPSGNPTAAPASTAASSSSTSTASPSKDTGKSSSNLYLFIIAGVVIAAAIAIVVVLKKGKSDD